MCSHSMYSPPLLCISDLLSCYEIYQTTPKVFYLAAQPGPNCLQGYTCG